MIGDPYYEEYGSQFVVSNKEKRRERLKSRCFEVLKSFESSR